MDGKNLLDKMELINPEYIEEADKMPRRKPVMLPQWAGLAACLAVAVGAVIMLVVFPDPDLAIMVSDGQMTASVFGSGGIALAVLLISLLAAAGIVAYMIKKRKK